MQSFSIPVGPSVLRWKTNITCINRCCPGELPHPKQSVDDMTGGRRDCQAHKTPDGRWQCAWESLWYE